jgi:SRSO17 transposase
MSNERDNPCHGAPFFDQLCQRFNEIFGHQAQKREFRNYLGGVLRENERKNLSQMAGNAVGVTYHKLHHFLTAGPWSISEMNQCRLEVMNQCHQSNIFRGFSLIIDNSWHS